MTDANSGASPRWDLERAVENSVLDPESRSILFALLRQMNGSPGISKKFSPSAARLVQVTGLSHGTVTDRLPKLRVLGWLEWAGKPGQKNVYTVRDGSSTCPHDGQVPVRTEDSTCPPDGQVEDPPPVRPEDTTCPPDGQVPVRPMDRHPPEDFQTYKDLKMGADAPSTGACEPEPGDGETTVPGSGTAQREDAENPPRPAPPDSRTAAPGGHPEVSPGMEAPDPQKKTRRPAKPKDSERARTDAIADTLAKAYWDKYGKHGTQSFIAVRSMLRKIMANEVDPREIGMAVARLGKAGKPVSPGWIQAEIATMRRERIPAAPPLRRAGAEDHEKYTRGFNGGKVLSI